MFNKVEKIRAVGIYYDYHHTQSELILKQNNVIFANNGYGKSTLTAILRSYMEQNPTYIEERKSIGEDADQEVLITIPNGVIKFENSTWSVHSPTGSNPKIAIFDDHFVTENLFFREVEMEHRKKICQLAFGEEANILQKQLTKSLNEEKSLRGLLRDRTKELEKKIKNSDFAEYLTMPKEIAEDAKSRLDSLEKELRTLRNSEKIAQLIDFTQFSPPDLKRDKELLNQISGALNLSVDNISEEINRTINNHFKKFKDDSQIETFARTGLEMAEDVCPFCGQHLDDAQELISAYSKYYSEAYQSLIKNVQQQKKNIEEWNYERILREIEKWVSDCESQKFKIQNVIGSQYEINKVDLSDYSEAVSNLVIGIKGALQAKLSNPLISIECEEVEELVIKIQQLEKVVDEYDAQTKEFIEPIKAKLGKSQKDNGLIDLEKNKKILESRIRRFLQEEVEWCDAYNKLFEQHRSAEEAVTSAKQQLNNYAENSFSTFQERINYYLQELRAQFRIGQMDWETNKVSTEPFANFNVVIREEAVCLKSRARSPEPQFSNTLSNGDRNTLSLAFFLSWLDAQPDLEEYIVVFDDPLTSMDENRLYGTSKVLGELSSRIRQLIVLTHKKDFLFQLDDELANLHGLCIKCDSTNGSRLEPYNIKYQRKDKHQKRIDRLTRYIDEDFGVTVNSIQEDIRKVLEKVLRLKYYPDFERINTLGSMIDNLKENGFLSEEIINQLYGLNNISCPTHHAEQAGKPINDLTREDLIPEIQLTLDIIRRI